MSGPVSTADTPAVPEHDAAHACDLEVLEGRAAIVGHFGVHRLLPRRVRRTVGAWCFVDHMGPGAVTAEHGLDIGPHPHIGLQTVTWLLEGEVLHRDSLGTEQVIRPGQLNLMTAGRGVSHSEEATGSYAGALHGVQLWVAQPSATRAGAPAFEHHASLPKVELDAAVATVLVGRFSDVESPARRDTAHVGVDLDVRPGATTVPLDASYEYALAVVSGAVTISGKDLTPGRLGYLGLGRDHLHIEARQPARVLLIGGEPFAEAVLMWWNYVARTREEITAAHRSWQADDGRFGHVASPLERIVTGGPPWGDD